MVIALGLIVIDIPSGLSLFSIPHKEGEDERVVAGTFETAHTLLAGEYAILPKDFFYNLCSYT